MERGESHYHTADEQVWKPMSSGSKATEDLLGQLHGALALHFKSLLEGEKPLTASELNVIRQYLKDNGIEAIATESNPLGQLTEALPFEVGGDNVTRFPSSK